MTKNNSIIHTQLTTNDVERVILAKLAAKPLRSERLFAILPGREVVRRLALLKLIEAGELCEVFTSGGVDGRRYYSRPEHVGDFVSVVAVVGRAPELPKMTTFAAKNAAEQAQRQAEQQQNDERLAPLNARRAAGEEQQEREALAAIEADWKALHNEYHVSHRVDQEQRPANQRALANGQFYRMIANEKRQFYKGEYRRQMGRDIPAELLDSIEPAPAPLTQAQVAELQKM